MTVDGFLDLLSTDDCRNILAQRDDLLDHASATAWLGARGDRHCRKRRLLHVDQRGCRGGQGDPRSLGVLGSLAGGKHEARCSTCLRDGSCRWAHRARYPWHRQGLDHRFGNKPAGILAIVSLLMTRDTGNKAQDYGLEAVKHLIDALGLDVLLKPVR